MGFSDGTKPAQARWWVIGLIPLFGLGLAAGVTETRPTERDLVTRAVAALKTGSWIPAIVTGRGREISLGGEAYDAKDRAAAIAAVDAVKGVRSVHDRSHLPPVAAPFVWSGTKASGAIALNGDVTKPQDRAQIFAAIAGAGAVDDKTIYASGAPAGFTPAVVQLARVFDQLKDGTVSIAGTKVSVKGVANDKAAAAAIDGALDKLPPGFTLAEKAITVPAYGFEAVKDSAAHNVTLSGTLPDTAARENLLKAAQKMFAGQDVIDRTHLQPGAPDGFVASVTAGLEQLSRLDGGTLKISDKAVELGGAALYDRAIDQIKAALGGAKVDLKTKPAGAAVDQSTCQQRFNDLLSKGTVQFETGSAKIDKVSAGILDHLVAIAAECPSQTLEISGHTDAAGNDAFNMDLSKMRAQAVVDYLGAAGLDAGHLTAIGYGKTKPIASNDTEDGKAKNRRIEFLVK